MPMSREERKWRAARRAQLSLKHALERIDYAIDVIEPEIQALRAREKELELAEDSDQAARDALPMPQEES